MFSFPLALPVTAALVAPLILFVIQFLELFPVEGLPDRNYFFSGRGHWGATAGLPPPLCTVLRALLSWLTHLPLCPTCFLQGSAAGFLLHVFHQAFFLLSLLLLLLYLTHSPFFAQYCVAKSNI